MSFLAAMFNRKAPFLTKKTSAVNSETHFTKEAVECGKVLKKTSIISRSWYFVKLFIM